MQAQNKWVNKEEREGVCVRDRYEKERREIEEGKVGAREKRRKESGMEGGRELAREGGRIE